MKANKFLILNFLALLITGIFARLLIVEVNATRRAVGELRQLEAQLKQASSYDKLMEQTASTRVKVADYFVAPDKLPSFIEDLENLADTAGVSFELTQAGLGTSPNKGLNFSLVAGGSYPALMHFLALLESFPHAVQLLEVQFNYQSAGEKKDEAPLWRAQIFGQLTNYAQ